MKTLHLYHGNRVVPIRYDELKDPKSEAARLKPEAEKLLGGGTLSSAAGAAVEKNLSHWMQKRREGHFSLGKALTPSTGKPPGVSLVGVRTIGTETELHEHYLKGPEVHYGRTIAKTPRMAEAHELAGTTVTVKDSDWPLMKLTIDGVNDALVKAAGRRHEDPSGHVEVVFGPLDISDAAEVARRGRVTTLFMQAFGEKRGGKLSDAVKRFNVLLDRTDDPQLKKYKLDTKIDLDISVGLRPHTTVQTNVEIPLRKIGDVKDTSLEALFGGRESDDKAMFLKAREQANALVDDVFRPTAARVHGGAFQEDSIKQEKLRGVFTLLLFDLGKQDHTGKDKWPILPKAGAGDLLREALSVRDKLTVFLHTQDPGAMKSLEDDLVARAKLVKAARSEGRETSSELEQDIRDEITLLLKPGELPDRWGTESTGYGSVDWSNDDYGGSVTGKPIPTTYDYEKHLLVSQDPKVVLEIRKDDNPNNGTLETLTKPEKWNGRVQPNLSTNQTFNNLVKSTQPTPRGDPKVES